MFSTDAISPQPRQQVYGKIACSHPLPVVYTVTQCNITLNLTLEHTRQFVCLEMTILVCTYVYPDMYDYTLQVLWTRRRKGDHGAGCQFNNLPGNSGPPSTPPPPLHTRPDNTTSCQQLLSTSDNHNTILMHPPPSQ